MQAIEANQMPTLNDVTRNAPTVNQYINSMPAGYRGGFVRQRDSYELDKDIVEKLRIYANDHEIVALFANWCGDSRRAIPVLAHLEDKIGLKVRALGGMTKPSWEEKRKNPGMNWAIPPSPREIETLSVTSSPTIIIFNNSGEEVGRIKTKPKVEKTVEAEILRIIEDSK
ncbi:MAG: thioredoxin family protein [Candidatus Thorarchaeota archaeon]